MFGGSILFGLTSFVACSSTSGGGDDGGDDGSGGSGTCQADTSSDPQNCGSCGNACLSTEACIGGQCRVSCTPPTTQCGMSCVDTSNNALHCGACNMACDSGELCQNNQCMMGECMNGTTLCNGACVNTQADLQNCGSCGTVCLQGQTCSSGMCMGGGTGGGSGGASGAGMTGGAGGMTGGESGAGMTGGASGAGMTGGAGGMTGGSGGMTGGSAGKGGAGTGGGGGGTTGACRVWVATNGNDNNPGTEASPVATLLKAYDLMCPKPPDGTENGAECLGPAPRSICVKSGTYNLTERLEFRKTRMGTASNRLILQGDPALPLSMRPILNFSNQPRLESCGAMPDNIGGITVNAHYVTVKNLVVRNANDTCILVQGTQGLIENVLTHNCADTGIQISSGGEYTGTGTNNTVRNCDSHTNADTLCDNENADGFAIKEGTGTGNVFTGCRAWNNADDGFDLYAWTSPVTIENSWAFDQSRTTEGGGSDGNGFKLGGDDVSAAHILRGLVAVGNVNGSNGDGFTPNSNPASLSCSNGCYAWGNTRNVASGVTGVSTTAQGNANVTNMAADSARNADGTLKAIGSL